MPIFPAAEYQSGTYHSGHEVFLHWGQETADLVPGGAAAGALPVLTFAGIYQGPGIQENENPYPVIGAGSMRPLAFGSGRRESTVQCRLQVADPAFLVAMGRGTLDDAPGWTKGLRRLALLTGTRDDWAGNFQRAARYAVPQSVRLQIAENQPVQADVTLWPLACMGGNSQAADSASSITTPLQDPHPANVLHWKHIGIVMTDQAGTDDDFRNIISSASINMTYNLERKGMRRDYGDDLPFSRCPYQIIAHDEQLTVDLQLHDRLPITFRNQAGQSSSWQTIVITGQSVVSGVTATLTLTVALNQLQSYSQNTVGPNAQLSYGAQVISSGLTIAGSIV